MLPSTSELPEKPIWLNASSDLLKTVEEKQQTISETATSSTSEQPYILTEENWDSIPAMIGITDADLKEIFGK